MFPDISSFTKMDAKLQNIIVEFLNDPIISKLLYYPYDDALSRPDVPDPYSLLRTQVYTQTFKPPVDAETTFLTVFFKSFDGVSNNPYLKKGQLYVGVCTHRNIWDIDNGTRMGQLIGAIDSILNRNRTSSSVTQDFFRKCDYRAISELYNGYDLIYDNIDAQQL